jgi:aminobenzoyl-glutamate utilization protein B
MILYIGGVLNVSTILVSDMPQRAREEAMNWITENQSRLVEISNKIWEWAELGLIEYKSSSLLADELEKNGFTVQRGVAGMPTALVASHGSGKPVIGVMGEYDALPGLSQKAVARKEPLILGGSGHGCGHNIHGTSGMAGAIAAKVAMEAGGFNGTIRFFGCPAEENFSGKAFMVRDGVFHDVDAVLSHHPSDMNAATLSSCLAVNSVKFSFHGEAAHAAASPEHGRSALDAVELMNVGVNYLREHVIQEARIHYIIDSGGEQPNIVPAFARSWYYVRAPEREQVESIYNRIIDIAKGAALMTGTTCNVELMEGTYNLIPNRTLAELVTKNMREIGTPKYTEEERVFAKEMAKTITSEEKKEELRKSKRPGWEKQLEADIDETVPDPWAEGEVAPASTDVAEVSWQAPTLEFSTACSILGIPWHSWQATAFAGMSIGHKSLIFASKTIAASVIDLLENPDILKRSQEEFKTRLQDRVYKSPLPPEAKPPLDAWKNESKHPRDT